MFSKNKKSKKNNTVKVIDVNHASQRDPSFKEASDKAIAPADPVSQYMQQISKYPLLSKEDERKWAIKYYDKKDSAAAEVLVTSNLRFVVKVASEYSKFGSRLIDLIQEGNVGLMQAVKDFNPYKGVRLITYAVWWIRGYIQEYLMKQYSMVKIGTTQNQRKLFYRLQKEKENMERLGHQAVIKQLSGKLDIPEEEIIEMTKRMSGKDISLSAPVDDEQQTTLMDFQSATTDEAIDEKLANLQEISQLTEVINQLRSELNERELDLLDNRLLSDSPVTLQQIGDKNQVSREAVRQMEARLIKKIKAKLIQLN